MKRKDSVTLEEAGIDPVSSMERGVDDLTPENMEIPFVLTGRSGTIYTPVDFIREMGTRHKTLAIKTLMPVLPLVYTFLATAQQSFARASAEQVLSEMDLNKELAALIGKIDLVEVFNALVMEDLDLTLLAILFLPKDGSRYLHESQIQERMEDLEDVPYGVKFEAFRRFFTGASSSSPSTFNGFIRGAMMKGGQALARSTNG